MISDQYSPEQFLDYLKGRIKVLEAEIVEHKAIVGELYSVKFMAERVVEAQKRQEADTDK